MTVRLPQLAHAPFFVSLSNLLVYAVLRAVVSLVLTILLTAGSRKTSEPGTTSVGLFEPDSRGCLFSTFGQVHWVHNLRAAG